MPLVLLVTQDQEKYVKVLENSCPRKRFIVERQRLPEEQPPRLTLRQLGYSLRKDRKTNDNSRQPRLALRNLNVLWS